MSLRRAIPAAVLAAAVTLPAVACSSSSTASTPSSSTAASANGVDPNAAEVNPAGDIPDDQVYVAWSPSGGGWSVQVPEGWARTDTATGATFTDKYNTVALSEGTATSAPTVDSTQATVVPELRSSNTNVADVKVSTVTRRAGDAVLVTYTADSPANDVTGKTVPIAVERYEFFRNGRSVVITLSGPVGADNVDPWRTVTDGFAWQ